MQVLRQDPITIFPLVSRRVSAIVQQRKLIFRTALVVSLIVAIWPSIVLSMNEYIDPFTFHTIGLAELYRRENRYTPYPILEVTGWQSTANDISVRFIPTLFVLILSEISGVSLWCLIFLPIIGFILPLCAYLVFKNLQNSTIATLYGIIVSLSLFTFNVNLFYISAGILMFFIFIFAFSRALILGQLNKEIEIVLMITFFIVAYFTYYTAEFLILIFLTSAFIVTRVFGKMCSQSLRARLFPLVFVFLAIFIVFDRVSYWFLENMSTERGIGLMRSYVEYIIRFLRGGETAVIEYRPHIGNPIVAYVDLILNFISWTIIVTYLMSNVSKLRQNKRGFLNACFESESIILVAFFMAGLSEMLIYLVVGYGVYTRTLMLFSSLASLYSLNKMRMRYCTKRKGLLFMVLTTVALCLVFLSVMRFILRVSDPLNPNGANLHSKMRGAVLWIITYDNNGVVVTDLRTVGQLFYELVKYEKETHIVLRRLGTEVYYLYNFTNEAIDKVFKEEDTLLLLSHEFEKRAFIAGEAWKIQPPLGKAFEMLDGSILISKIYDDEFGIVYYYC